MKITIVYFSATYTTQRIVRHIAGQFGTDDIREYDITNQLPAEDISVGHSELLIIGAPVYSGRIPMKAREAFMRLKGDHTAAVLVAVYGNREYEDALVEMRDIVENSGFWVVSAAAFVAQHSIFSHVASGRPDERDMRRVAEYGLQLSRLFDQTNDLNTLFLEIKGNRPYREVGTSHIVPILVDEECNGCGTCVELCPFTAINPEDPFVTNYERCQTCGRCIVVCPLQVRHFSGPFFEMAGQKFAVALAARKEPEVFMPEDQCRE